jgi:hypothetical protein
MAGTRRATATDGRIIGEIAVKEKPPLGQGSHAVRLPQRQQAGLHLPDRSQAHQRTDRADDARQHVGERRSLARRVPATCAPPPWTVIEPVNRARA